MNDPQILRDLKPAKDFFIGIDSDGCAFGGMDLKHNECFGPMFIKQFDLQAVAPVAREVWNFVNLYSKTRGSNRFQALARALNLLRERKEVVSSGVAVADTKELEAWIARSGNLSNAALKQEVDAGNRALAPALAWSRGVNQAVESLDTDVPPFPFVSESLRKSAQSADVIVVSQAPAETLAREWKKHGIDAYVRVLAGQELGTKTDHIGLAAVGKYAADRILMIGDAPGDLKAARANHALFFPIVPGREEASWERYLKEGLDRFLSGAYAGDYECRLVREFDASLPEKPGW